MPNLTVTVNDAEKYQQYGWLRRLPNESSAWLIWSKLTEAQRKEP